MSLAIKLILVAAVAGLLFECRVMSAPPKEEAPTPHEFAFTEQNANHTLARRESGDGQAVSGQLTYTDENGTVHTVTFVADDDGFKPDMNQSVLRKIRMNELQN